jgi:hypothetical protein
VLSATYRSNMAPHVSNLPSPARGAASESISGGYAVADRLGAAGQALIGHVNDAFVQAMHYSAIGSAVVALVGAIVVVIWLPRHSAVPALVPVEAAEDSRELAEVA